MANAILKTNQNCLFNTCIPFSLLSQMFLYISICPLWHCVAGIFLGVLRMAPNNSPDRYSGHGLRRQANMSCVRLHRSSGIPYNYVEPLDPSFLYNFPIKINKCHFSSGTSCTQKVAEYHKLLLKQVKSFFHLPLA